MSATKPQLAGGLLQDAHDRGIGAGFTAGDEVYGGLDLRKSIRERGTGYVLAVCSTCMVALPSGRRRTVKPPPAWPAPACGSGCAPARPPRSAKDYHWAMIEITPEDTPEGQDPGHAVLLLRRHRYTGTVGSYLCWSPRPVPLAKPGATGRTATPGHCGDVGTSTEPARPASDGTPTPTRCHGNDLQLP